MPAPSRPARPSRRMSSIVMIVLQHGHCAPARDMVPGPIRLSCSRRWAALPPLTGTLFSMPKTAPVFSAFGAIVRSTRFLPSFFLQSQRVLRRGTVARQFLHVTVRAHRYATVGLATQRGLVLAA